MKARHKNGTRVATVCAVFSKNKDLGPIRRELLASSGDVHAVVAALKGSISPLSLETLTLANSLAEWSSDNVEVVKTFAKQAKVASLRDIALNYSTDKLAATIPAKAVPGDTPGETAEAKARNYATTLQKSLFASQTSAVLQRMVHDQTVPVADEALRAHVVAFLDRQPDFDIRRTSIYTALQQPDALKDVPDDQRSNLVDQLKTLQRVQALAPVPAAVPTLMKANLTSAFHVTEMPESKFLEAYGDALGPDTARQVYTNAVNARLQNEQALMTMHESIRGTGLAIIDGPDTLPQRRNKLQRIADKHAVPLNLETLFGSMDYCECEDCLSVYSPASYFVELLQYLRNNNLQPGHANTGVKGIAGTPLEKLFRRRPDLGCLELTCENTFTVLPYVDLASEVMESFIVHRSDYEISGLNPKQAKLDVFNVKDETTSELLAQPQHINLEAYCTLKNAVYPFTLPYHQPIDAIRIFLDYMGTSRCELLKRFRTATENVDVSAFSGADQAAIGSLHQDVMRRAAHAECLGMCQEEYIILTREAFWPKHYFEITQSTTLTDADYQQKIGVRSAYAYYGYTSQTEMLDTSAAVGLAFVKKQFLPRTGILYKDLVALLQTHSINPNLPQGKALELMESLHFSYRFLQSLIDTTTNDSKMRFAKLIEFLNKEEALVPKLIAHLHPDPCHQRELDCCSEEQRAIDFTRWVYCYFERIGKLIVLESGDGPTLPIYGDLYQRGERPVQVGTLEADGTIVDVKGRIIGKVTPDLAVVDPKGNQLKTVEGLVVTGPSDPGHTPVGVFYRGVLLTRDEKPVRWMPAQDSCDLEKVRLTHLDGTPVTVDEYDRIQRFIRLWRKLGWTIDEIDQALMGYALPGGGSGGTSAPGPVPSGPALSAPAPGSGQFISFDAFKDDCSAGPDDTGDCGCGHTKREGGSAIRCPDEAPAIFNITTEFVDQLVAIKKLLERTSLPLAKLLTFWANISMRGNNSLYATLFLSHSMRGIDSVFKADPNGEFLMAPARITDHVPVLMAALRLKADDISIIMKFRSLPDTLTIHNVSVLYRHSLLARVLKAKVAELPQIIGLLGDPFASASDALRMLRTWDRMVDAGFNLRQLNYLINDQDDPQHPLGPQQKTVLRLSKVLYDGLTRIEADQPNFDPARPDLATDDAVRAKAGLVFDAPTVEQIIGLLDGTAAYATNAPLNLAITVPPALAGKVKYTNLPTATPPTANLQLTGILTPAEVLGAKSILPGDVNWAQAIDRAGKQSAHFFEDVLAGMFTNVTSAKAQLLQGDVLVSADQVLQMLPAPDPNTAPAKRMYFLLQFMPFLRQQLERRLIVDAVAGACSTDGGVTDTLLSNILTAGAPKQAALTVLQSIKDAPAAPPPIWHGYLIAPSATDYTFVVTSATPPQPLVLDGNSIKFSHQQDDPNDVWWTDPVPLKSATLYSLEVHGAPDNLKWRTALAPASVIPDSALLPDYSTSGTQEVLTKMYRAAILVNGFNLAVAEVNYLQSHAADFASFDFNKVSLAHWKRVRAYAALRDELPKYDTTLLDLFAWASAPDDPTKLTAKISATTGWKPERIASLIAPQHYDLGTPDSFKNEVQLARLQKALALADKTGMDIGSLFTWANPSSEFWLCHTIADDVHKALRSRFDVDAWEKVVKPLNDKLRGHEQQALVAYLVVEPDLVAWGVVDADSLFEFFLIDMQMCACMQTSRIKQAISSVQTFVQRCMMGLEDPDVTADALDRDRWEWMQKYRLWEANRKVFLYPENWIRTELRDDKSSFYEQLESELLQKDINQGSVVDALKTYLFKVDGIANLQPLGLFDDSDQGRVHVFARTHGAPYHFYYRYFDKLESNWYAWEKVEVDIPSYDHEDQWKFVINGSYLTPVIWHRRLLIFFPQIVRKQNPQNPTVTATKHDDNYDVNAPASQEFWEIKLAWSEYRNGKWTQKQVSKDCLIGYPDTTPIHRFVLVPDIQDEKVTIGVYDAYPSAKASPYGAFDFVGSQLFGAGTSVNMAPTGLPGRFNYNDTNYQVHSLQIPSPSTQPPLLAKAPFFLDTTSGDERHFTANMPALPAQNFAHSFSHQLLGKINSGDLDDLYAYYATLTPATAADAYGLYIDTAGAKSFNELKRPYALYNWELGFHTPMALMAKLAAAGQFDQALAICHKVFDPAPPKGAGPTRFWQFPPFQQIDATNTLESLFLSLKPNQPNADINAWRNKPFEPHVVARSRPSAYMKWTVMRYIQTLIDYGDYYFRQNTLETLPTALQYYVLASHIYGQRAQRIPKRGKILAETYNSLLDKWDAFGNAMVELELAFPFSNQTSLPVGSSNGVVGFANVFGFATSLYFCIPMNPQLEALRTTIDDRLFKIRHCEDINGVFRQLPLFEPPIDPGLLVEAAAEGLSLASVLSDLNSPMPNYRFYYLLQKALELCNELKSLGSAFLSAMEKGDAEALAALRAVHETTINTLVMEVRKQQLEEAQKSIDALEQSRKGPVFRLQHYSKLIGAGLDPVPDEDTDFNEIADPIDDPIADSGLELSPLESEEMALAKGAADLQKEIGQLETLASIMNMIPNFSVNLEPFGCGASISFGGSNIGAAMQAMARNLQTTASDLTYQSTNAGRKAGYQRQLQERILQANIAGYEIKNIDRQILTQKIRLSIAQQEIVNQQMQIDNSKEVEDFLRDKYTSVQLYSWLQDTLRGLHYQAYTLAYDLAKRAEKLFHFERGPTDSNLVQSGYWDVGHDGLLAGERLYLALKQMEAAYLEKRGYDFEIPNKPISLRQLNPLALVALRATGRCTFTIPEVLFDMDYPGHYMRRIKAISVVIPSVVGPYTSLNCTLRLLEHTYRVDPTVADKNDYGQRIDGTEPDDRFATTNVPIAAIAVSSGQNDSGLFELNFRDERYLPFEGAGAVSQWQLELADFRQFDYDTISDVILNMRYTSMDGGDKLRAPAQASVQAYVKSIQDLSQDQGLFAAFDLRHDFPNEWYKGTQSTSPVPVISLSDINERLPIFTKDHKAAKIQATDIYLVADKNSAITGVVVTENGNDQVLTAGGIVGDMKLFAANDLPGCPMDTWSVSFQGVKPSLDRLWLVARYVML